MKIPSKTKQANLTPSSNVLNVEELCEYLQISPVTVYRLLKRKRLPGFRILGNWRFNIEDVDRWIKEGPGSMRQSGGQAEFTETKSTVAAPTALAEEIKSKRMLLVSETHRYFEHLSAELRTKWENVSLRLGPEVAALSLRSVLVPAMTSRMRTRKADSGELSQQAAGEPDQQGNVARSVGIENDRLSTEGLLNRELLALVALNQSMQALAQRLDELQQGQAVRSEKTS